jgi:hypothetical protein
MCKRLKNSVMILDLNFMPLDKIFDMSLNDLRRLVETCDKNQTRTQMEEPSIALDPRHQFQLVGPIHCHYVS